MSRGGRPWRARSQTVAGSSKAISSNPGQTSIGGPSQPPRANQPEIVSGAMIGLNTALAGVAGICIVPFVPRLAARFGVVTLLWLSIAVAIASFLGFKILFDFAWWFPLRLLFAASFGTLFVLSEYWINAAAPPERRGLVMGVYATVLAIGFAIAPAALKLVGTSGWPPYLAGAALSALAALPLLAAHGLSPALEGRASRSVLSFILAAPLATLAALVFGAA